MMHITLLISKNTDEIRKVVVLKLIFLLTYEQEEKNLKLWDL